MAVPRETNRLIFVPHGCLCGVPLHALPLGCDGEQSIYKFNGQILLDRFSFGVMCARSIPSASAPSARAICPPVRTFARQCEPAAPIFKD
jgi:hypothetical protein